MLQNIKLTDGSEEFLEILDASQGIIFSPENVRTKLMLRELYSQGLIVDSRPRPYTFGGKNVFAVELTENARNYMTVKCAKREIEPVKIFGGNSK